jgi:hypothetical protein
MSKLYGYLTGDRDGSSTRASAHTIESIVQTESARIVVTLTADGGFSVRVKRGDRASGYSEVTAWIEGNAHAAAPITEVRTFGAPTIDLVEAWCVELRRKFNSADELIVVIHGGLKRNENWISARTLDVYEFNGLSRDDVTARAAAIAAARGATLRGFVKDAR